MAIFNLTWDAISSERIIMCSIPLRNWSMEEGMSQHFSWQLSSCTSEMQDQCLATNILPFNRTLQFAYELLAGPWHFKHTWWSLWAWSLTSTIIAWKQKRHRPTCDKMHPTKRACSESSVVLCWPWAVLLKLLPSDWQRQRKQQRRAENISNCDSSAQNKCAQIHPYCARALVSERTQPVYAYTLTTRLKGYCRVQ